MNFYLVGEINGQKVIFGQGNTTRTALAAGKWNATKRGVDHTIVMSENRLPKTAVWYDTL